LKTALLMRFEAPESFNQAPAQKPPPFVTLPDGLSELIEALASRVRVAGS
jgi:hypothetical protein